LTLALLLLALAAVTAREFAEGRALRAGLLDLHRQCGLFVLVLCLWRLALRWRLGRLPALAATGLLQRRVAASVHAALYLLLAGVPLAGWLLSAALGQPAGLLGWPLPGAVAADEDLAESLHSAHVALALTLSALVLLHAGAALWHHFIQRVGLLLAMALWRRPKSRAEQQHRSTPETT
jgi:cytochrome b561